FLPSGLFNACPHAPSRASKLADMGRRRTNLKTTRRPTQLGEWSVYLKSRRCGQGSSNGGLGLIVLRNGVA
ncbi:hypothetical protein, partial [Paraburkholderia aspalathi]|uniref:hypothetical protein n=1 Tax=Paraburkholderia aspalathi TaxID=1324617 RepID=UPI001ABFAB61